MQKQKIQVCCQLRTPEFKKMIVSKKLPKRISLNQIKPKAIVPKVITPQLFQLTSNLIKSETSLSKPDLQRKTRLPPQSQTREASRKQLDQVIIEDFDDQIQQLLCSRFQQLNMNHAKKYDVGDMFNDLETGDKQDFTLENKQKHISSLISPQFTLTNITGLNQEELEEFELHQHYIQ